MTARRRSLRGVAAALKAAGRLKTESGATHSTGGSAQVRSRGPLEFSWKSGSAEEAYALNVLEPARRQAWFHIDRWHHHAQRFKIAPGAWFTPDFSIVFTTGEVWQVDVKGHQREAARVRLMVAASVFPEYVWIRAQAEGRHPPWRFREERVTPSGTFEILHEGQRLVMPAVYLEPEP